jgi:hypothetical protein
MAKIHTIGGAQYREVAREVRYGDQYIVPLDGYFDITEGKPYKVTGIDPDGDPEFVDDAGDPSGLSEGEYVVLEPVTATSDLSALEFELAEMKAKVAEMERQLAEVKKGAPEDRLKVGDYAKIAEGIDDGYAKSGDIVEIIDTGRRFDFKVRKIGDTNGCTYFDAAALVRATDEEVAEAKHKLARHKIQPGVYVKLQIPEGSRPRYGWGDAKNGDIGKVASRDGDSVRVDFPAHSYWHADINEIVLVTEEERKQAEKAERKKAEEAKWAAIGRKPGEFKVGDIAKITRY